VAEQNAGRIAEFMGNPSGILFFGDGVGGGGVAKNIRGPCIPMESVPDGP
jgi:hypothetical protein